MNRFQTLATVDCLLRNASNLERQADMLAAYPRPLAGWPQADAVFDPAAVITRHEIPAVLPYASPGRVIYLRDLAARLRALAGGKLSAYRRASQQI